MQNTLFSFPPRSTKEGDILSAKKSNKTLKKNTNISGGKGGLFGKIQAITQMVDKYLGKYKDDYIYITDEQEFIEYIDKIIEFGYVAIDTETLGLNVMLDDIVGLCLYCPIVKPAYIPINHVSYITLERVSEQLSREFIASQLERLNEHGVKNIFFNANFDIRVIRHSLKVYLKCYWDCYIAQRLLNENEQSNGLKPLHEKYCGNKSPDEAKAFSFGALFKGIPFSQVPIKVGYLYASRDALITWELFKFQEPYLTPDNEVCIKKDLVDVAKLYLDTELPIIEVVADMEDNGMAFDLNKSNELSEKYHKKLDTITERFYKMIDDIKNDIDKYRMVTGEKCALSDPINIASAKQIAILLYDILNIPSPDTKNPRGTGEEILLKIDHEIAKIILEYRGVSKLLSTYIDKLPNEINPNTGRIHCIFNQMGADTGRFSSESPNMQNIPSHNKEIRQMFVASEGNILLSSDYSAQEPRITAHLSKDEKMIQAYKEGKDLYVEIASLAYNLPYEECKEFRADGSTNADGKERRGHAKAIVLGVCYGKGIPAIAEDLNISVKKAQEIYDKIMKSFPALEKFMNDSQQMAKDLGFVTTVWGRKRRLPNMQLPPYEFSYDRTKAKNFDPLDFESDDNLEVEPHIIHYYTDKLSRCRSYKDKERIKEIAKNSGIIIKDNGGYIAEATRQCVNSRVQGSASDMTKKAMILVHQNKRLKELGFKLLLTVHDELIGECPIEHKEEVAKLFSQLMIEGAKDLVVPSKCDVEGMFAWSGEKISLT